MDDYDGGSVCSKSSDGEVDDVAVLPGSIDDDIEKSVPLSSLAWEAYELSSDWSKSLKGDHGILAALDLSLPLPMCNVDLSSPTKPRDILDIFSDDMDLPPLNNFIESRMDTGDDRAEYSSDQCGSPPTVDGMDQSANIGACSSGKELDRSNTLMTPQELERMPDQGLEFEQSVGPKESPQQMPPPPPVAQVDTDDLAIADQVLEDYQTSLNPADAPVILSQQGEELTTITVLTSVGEKMFKVNTGQLRQAASQMQPVMINAEGGKTNFVLVMLPVAKMKMLQPSSQGGANMAKYKCLHCDRTFMRSYKLRLHERMKHMAEKPFKCVIPGCKWEFPDAYRLKNHERSHLKLKTHTCEQCGKKYSTIWNLRSHFAQQHDDEKNQHKCDLCPKSFAAEIKLQKHITDEHPEQPKQFKCDEEGCTEEFHSKLGLMRHIVGHKKRKELNLVCPFEGCDKTFDWKSRLDLHISWHKGEANYQCTFQGCTGSFISQSVLNRHKKTHLSDKKFQCKLCPKTFHRPDHLRHHESAHTMVKAFSCPEPGCKHASTTKNALASHLKRHALKANRALLVCLDQRCTYTCGSKIQLIKHINAHHPNIMEMQYTKELVETNPELLTEEEAERTETLLATAALSNTNDVNMDWSLDLTTQSQAEVTVLNTEVAGKQVELLLPKELIDGEEDASVDCKAANIPSVMPYPVSTKSIECIPKREKGSARTDSLVNEKLCLKARARQLRQKAQSLPVETTEVIDVQPKMVVTESTFSAAAGDEISLGYGVMEMPATSLPNLIVTMSTGVPNSVTSSIPSNLVQWFSSDGQVGADDSDTLYASGNPEVLAPLAEDIGDGSGYDVQLYNSLE